MLKSLAVLPILLPCTQAEPAFQRSSDTPPIPNTQV